MLRWYFRLQDELELQIETQPAKNIADTLYSPRRFDAMSRSYHTLQCFLTKPIFNAQDRTRPVFFKNGGYNW